MAKDDLAAKLEKQKEAVKMLEVADAAVSEEKADLTPGQIEETLFSIETWGKSFCRGGFNWKCFQAIQENIKLLRMYNPNFINAMGKDLFARSAGAKFIIENLLSGSHILNESSEMLDILSKVAATKQDSENPFVERGE